MVTTVRESQQEWLLGTTTHAFGVLCKHALYSAHGLTPKHFFWKKQRSTTKHRFISHVVATLQSNAKGTNTKLLANTHDYKSVILGAKKKTTRPQFVSWYVIRKGWSFAAEIRMSFDV